MLFKEASEAQFRTILKTEVCRFNTFPYFVRKAWLPSLNMADPLEYARASEVEIQIRDGRTLLGSATTDVASLLLEGGRRLQTTGGKRRFMRKYHLWVLVSVESYMTDIPQPSETSSNLDQESESELDTTFLIESGKWLAKIGQGKKYRFIISRGNRLGIAV